MRSFRSKPLEDATSRNPAPAVDQVTDQRGELTDVRQSFCFENLLVSIILPVPIPAAVIHPFLQHILCRREAGMTCPSTSTATISPFMVAASAIVRFEKPYPNP